MNKYLQYALAAKHAYSRKSGSNNDVEYYIINYKETGELVIGIRGTERGSMKDLWRDLYLFPATEHYRTGHCHPGYLNAALDIEASIKEEIALERFVNITLVGHSMGGAIAILLARILQHDKYPITKVVTFGAPKCVHTRSVNLYADLDIIELCNYGDWVPTFPPFCYSHIQMELLGDPKTKRSSLFTWRRNHDMDNYIENLRT